MAQRLLRHREQGWPTVATQPGLERSLEVVWQVRRHGTRQGTGARLDDSTALDSMRGARTIMNNNRRSAAVKA